MTSASDPWDEATTASKDAGGGGGGGIVLPERLPGDVDLKAGGSGDPLQIVVDTREQKGWTWDTPNVIVRRATLKTGDYSVVGLEDRVALERKSIGDLVQTVSRDWLRFRKELNRLSGYDVAAICVEGNIEQVVRHEYESEATPASVLGRINGIQIDHGVPVLWWGDRKTAAMMAYRLLLLSWRKLAHEIER